VQDLKSIAKRYQCGIRLRDFQHRNVIWFEIERDRYIVVIVAGPLTFLSRELVNSLIRELADRTAFPPSDLAWGKS
jgi:ABC-type microcin C transport system permease subunit YejB